jgi:Uma2 family endonuclease
MGLTANSSITGTLVLQLPANGLSEEAFFEFCQLNRDLRIERDADGNLLVMPPANSETSRRNASLTIKIGIWNERQQFGEVFDSSSGFTLPDNSILSPDVSWIQKERWTSLAPHEQNKFARIVPDFVLELRSPSDSMKWLKQKMDNYLRNGVRLAWLIDPNRRETHVYQPGKAVFVVPFDRPLSGDDVLPGFELVLSTLFTD